MSFRLKAAKLPPNRQDLTITNFLYVSHNSFRALASRAPSVPHVAPGTILCECKTLVLNVKPENDCPDEQVMLNNPTRESARIATRDDVPIRVFQPPKYHFIAGIVSCDITTYVPQSSRLNVKEAEIIPVFQKYFLGQVLSLGQMLAVPWGSAQALKFSVIKVVPLDAVDCDELQEKVVQHGMLTPSTQFMFTTAGDGKVNVESDSAQKSIFSAEMSFQELAVGGLDKELQFIFRRAFASRVFPPSVVKECGIKHVRGMLLYGPPGTGKTLIAREITRVLKAVPPKIVNGPEVLNKYVGQSEENIRKLFFEAETDQAKKGDASPLHTIIFDEIDAICKQRGSVSSSTGVNDSVVNQLLSKIDGIEALSNILLIGMTNRRDLIDPALLRPGRLEVLVEIGLPDEKGRLQILNIHTRELRKSNRLGQDVSLASLASTSCNFTGAELESLVKAAVSNAMSKQLDKENPTKPISTERLVVGRSAFEQALDEIVPQFGSDDRGFDDVMQDGIVSFGESFDCVLKSLQDSTKPPLFGRRMRTVLLYGARGSGKTALAAHVSKLADYPFMKLVTPASLQGSSDSEVVAKLWEVFNDAFKSSASLIVLDDIETIAGFIPVGMRYSGAVLNTFKALLTTMPKPGRTALVIGTTSEMGFLKDSGVAHLFAKCLEMPILEEAHQIQAILTSRQVQYGDFPSEEIAAVMRDHTLLHPIGIRYLFTAMRDAAESCQPDHISYASFKESYARKREMFE